MSFFQLVEGVFEALEITRCLLTPLVYEIFCGVAGERGGEEMICEGAFILVHHLIDLRCRALIGTATITSNIDAISGAVAAACPAFASSSPPAEFT